MDAGMLNSGFLLDQKVSPRNLAVCQIKGALLCISYPKNTSPETC